MSMTMAAVDLEARLVLAERAIAESAARIADMTRVLSEFAQIGRPPDLANAKSIEIGADTVSPFAIGFYDREFDVGDRPYRWTGKGNLFELRVQVNRSLEWDFAMELQNNSHVDVSKLRAYLDYAEIPITVNQSDAMVMGIIPQKPFSNCATLTFCLPNLFVPNQLSPDATDTRTLGLVFYGFRADPKFVKELFSPRLGAGELVKTTDGLRESRDPASAPAGANSSGGGNLLRKRRIGFAAGIPAIKG